MALPPSASDRQLRQLSPDRIKRNPDNPRLFFRSEELDTLTASIRAYGIQVPITVYADGEDFVLIDGERRWRCARKLNLQKIPALVQSKPSTLDNLLLMFNIHALREQWDYLTIANKLPVIIDLYKLDHYGQEPNEIQLSEMTGLTRAQIRRCRFLFDLPESYKKQLEDELSRPKNLQVLSEDFFIEMERALKTVRGRVPAAIPDMNAARDVLIGKFRRKVIKNITDFRKLSKIATSVDGLGVKESQARSAIVSILQPDNRVSISDVFSERFETKYDQRRLEQNVDAIFNFLSDMEDENSLSLDQQIRGRLLVLAKQIIRLLD